MPLKKDTRDAGLGEERRLVFHCIPFCVFWEKILNYVYALSFWLKRKYVGGRRSLKKIPRFYLASQVLLLPCLCGQVLQFWLTGHFLGPLSQPQSMPTPPPGSITTSHRYLKPTFSPRNTNNSTLERRLSFIALTEQTEISWLWDAR